LESVAADVRNISRAKKISREAVAYRRVHFLLSSSELFTTDSEEKDHGNTRQEVSREVRRQDRQQASTVASSRWKVDETTVDEEFGEARQWAAKGRTKKCTKESSAT
jgi:DNA primase large subunit